MARRTLFWHIGPEDAGTDFLQPALQLVAPALAERDIKVVTGTWPERAAAVWKHKGVSVLSTPNVARADDELIELRRSGFRDVDVHLVFTVRDLPTQIHAAWLQTQLTGSSTSLAAFTRRVMDASREHWQAEEFWASRDLSSLLLRWTHAMHAERVHILAVEPDPASIWASFDELLGGVLPSFPTMSSLPVRSAPVDAIRALEIAEGWEKTIADAGFDLRGDLALRPTSTTIPDGESDSGLVELLQTTASEAERLRNEIAALRAENERLDRKRRKHKRRLAELISQLENQTPAS